MGWSDTHIYMLKRVLVNLTSFPLIPNLPGILSETRITHCVIQFKRCTV